MLFRKFTSVVMFYETNNMYCIYLKALSPSQKFDNLTITSIDWSTKVFLFIQFVLKLTKTLINYDL